MGVIRAATWHMGPGMHGGGMGDWGERLGGGGVGVITALQPTTEIMANRPRALRLTNHRRGGGLLYGDGSTGGVATRLQG
jgi:hypothetical protein